MRQWERQGRRVAAVNFTLPVDALEILRTHAPTPRAQGDFLSRLLYEFKARQEERARLRQELQAVVSE